MLGIAEQLRRLFGLPGGPGEKDVLPADDGQLDASSCPDLEDVESRLAHRKAKMKLGEEPNRA